MQTISIIFIYLYFIKKNKKNVKVLAATFDTEHWVQTELCKIEKKMAQESLK